jgi:dephospho-CoA kinase
MAVIGITGGIGCGKSTFTRMLAEMLHAPFFETDATARELLDSDPEVRALVTREVLATAYGADGRPDRRAIRQAVFHDPAAMGRLEKILHPRIRKRWMSQAADALSRGEFFLVEIPLLFETGAQDLFDHIVTVACSEETQLRRVTARGLEPAEARAILQNQLPLAEKCNRAGFVVWNDGTPDNLRRQAQELRQRLSP